MEGTGDGSVVFTAWYVTTSVDFVPLTVEVLGDPFVVKLVVVPLVAEVLDDPVIVVVSESLGCFCCSSGCGLWQSRAC